MRPSNISITVDEAKELIESFGAKSSNSISTNTDYLIIGNNPGSKLTKSKKLNIIILNELKFKELIDSL